MTSIPPTSINQPGIPETSAPMITRIIPQIIRSNSRIFENDFVAPMIRAIALKAIKIIGQIILVAPIIQPSKPLPPRYQGVKMLTFTKLKIPATTPNIPPSKAERNPILSNLTIVFNSSIQIVIDSNNSHKVN